MDHVLDAVGRLHDDDMEGGIHLVLRGFERAVIRRHWTRSLTTLSTKRDRSRQRDTTKQRGMSSHRLTPNTLHIFGGHVMQAYKDREPASSGCQRACPTNGE